jgi:hypothetical protein
MGVIYAAYSGCWLWLGQQVVLGAWPAAVDRAKPDRLPGIPLLARTCEPSMTTRAQSIWPAAWSPASSRAWSWSQTPAACQSRSRRQQVIPEP